MENDSRLNEFIDVTPHYDEETGDLHLTSAALLANQMIMTYALQDLFMSDFMTDQGTMRANPKDRNAMVVIMKTIAHASDALKNFNEVNRQPETRLSSGDLTLDETRSGMEDLLDKRNNLKDVTTTKIYSTIDEAIQSLIQKDESEESSDQEQARTAQEQARTAAKSAANLRQLIEIPFEEKFQQYEGEFEPDRYLKHLSEGLLYYRFQSSLCRCFVYTSNVNKPVYDLLGTEQISGLTWFSYSLVDDEIFTVEGGLDFVSSEPFYYVPFEALLEFIEIPKNLTKNIQELSTVDKMSQLKFISMGEPSQIGAVPMWMIPESSGSFEEFRDLIVINTPIYMFSHSVHNCTIPEFHLCRFYPDHHGQVKLTDTVTGLIYDVHSYDRFYVFTPTHLYELWKSRTESVKVESVKVEEEEEEELPDHYWDL